MAQLNDNPMQGNRGGQEYGEDNYHKSQRNQQSQRHQTPPEDEKRKQQENDDQFSPGEPEEYDGEDFVTD
ncbi:hypothetical protein [Flavobacterium coralii]|uniref:hypothetical protein n=1 Tax=Flavobacterium coralii TaxID=2838017 RepID=UPI001CA7340A|nr:hypothetical protein [Flavobacterium coralii]MBY8962691.1 hypothetical protein [Flavobacterium coralii]|tara:strand:- start:32785 stop:32994 length:210 start_codon:yes stop_codon:yes gene_type:complete